MLLTTTVATQNLWQKFLFYQPLIPHLASTGE